MPAEPGCEHVVLRAGVVLAQPEPGERLRRRVGERHEACLPALCRALDAGAERTVHDEDSVREVDVSPAEREQFAEPQPGVAGDPDQLGVLAVLDLAPGALLGGQIAGRCASAALCLKLRAAAKRADAGHR